MHGLRAQLVEIETIFHSMREQTGKVDLLVCEPATLLARLVASARGLIEIGGEDCSAEEAGSLTGDIEAEIVRDAGATSVILGHSERRQRHHETDAIVAAMAKVKAAWQHAKSSGCVDSEAVGGHAGALAKTLGLARAAAARAKSLLVRNRKHVGRVLAGDSAESLRRTSVLDGRRSEVGADC